MNVGMRWACATRERKAKGKDPGNECLPRSESAGSFSQIVLNILASRELVIEVIMNERMIWVDYPHWAIAPSFAKLLKILETFRN